MLAIKTVYISTRGRNNLFSENNQEKCVQVLSDSETFHTDIKLIAFLQINMFKVLADTANFYFVEYYVGGDSDQPLLNTVNFCL